MNYTMQNDLAKVTINSHGAELASFILKNGGTEYIWQGDPKIWGRHAPVLFPIVGKLKDDSYQVKGQKYSLSQHGFARDSQFELISSGVDHCSYRLTSNAQTLVNYPYHFELTVSYRLKGATLSVTYEVRNTGQDVMHFSIGAHPGFNCPLRPTEETMEDYVIEFSTAENAQRIRVENGLISSRQTPFLENESSFRLSAPLFDNDALIFSDLKSDTVTLRSQKTGKFVEMDITGFPYLGIWSKAGGAPFVCLEPWFGLADKVDSDYDFETKTGIQRLGPSQVFACTHTITVG